MSVAEFDQKVYKAPPSELVEFARRQVFNALYDKRLERRSVGRTAMVVPGFAQPVDGDSRPIGAPFDIVTRELSSKGADLVHFDPITHDKLALFMRFEHEEVNLLVQVKWRRPLGPFNDCGVEFITRLKDFPFQSESSWPVA